MLLHKKLNVGCGFDIREGYTNVDINAFHKPDIVADIADIHQVEDSFAEEVLAQDVLEHVPRTKVMPALVEWNRVLQINGILRLRVPDLKSIAKMILSGGNESTVVDMLYGTQSYTGDFHMAGFTTESLADELRQAGFLTESMEISDGWLISASARKVGGARSEVFELAKNKNLSHSDFVKSIYKALLGREADAEGLQHFVDTLNGGARDRHQVAATIAKSDEARRRGARLVETSTG
jgi:predicted SAM-dependent methyltransferase